MIEGRENRKFIPVEETYLDMPESENVNRAFGGVLKEMSDVLDEEVEIIVNDIVSGSEQKPINKIRLEFIDETANVLVVLEWRKQEQVDPGLMQAGLVDIISPKLKGLDLGYRILQAKRDLGKTMGYKEMMITSKLGKETYAENVVDRDEEKDYEWKRLEGEDEPYGGAMISYRGKIV